MSERVPGWFKWRDSSRWFVYPRTWTPPPLVRRNILIAYRR